MFPFVIALFVIALLYYCTKQVPKPEKYNNGKVDFSEINKQNIIDFGNNKIARDIEEFGKKLVNGEIMVDDYGNMYTDKIDNWVDAK